MRYRTSGSASLIAALFTASAAPAFGDPTLVAAAADPAPEAVVADLAFEPYHEPNRIILDLAPDGQRPFQLMLETGAATSVLTPRTARSLGVTVRKLKRSPYRKATILGRDLQFYVNTRRSDTASTVASEYGLLGADFLDDYILEIDFPRRRVRFLDPKRYELPKTVTASDEAILPLRMNGTRIAVEIELNGRSGLVLLDTGAPGTLLLSGKLARMLDIDVDSLEEHGRAEGTAGPVAVRRYETDSFRIAGFEFEAMPVLVSPTGWYNIAGPTDSFVGYDVLSQFVVRIDFEGRRIWLKRSGDHRVTLYGADYQLSKRIGALVVPVASGYSVRDVEPDGVAAAFGLRDGDKIVIPAGGGAISSDEILARIEFGRELTVARQRGDVWGDVILPDPPPSSEDAPTDP